MGLNIKQSLIIEPTKQKPGRNDPCYCGSGKKYKKCHLIIDEQKTNIDTGPKSGLISRVIDWATKQPWFKSHLDLVMDYLLGPSRRLEQPELQEVIEAAIFAAPVGVLTPLERFVKEAPLSQADRKLYQSWFDKTGFGYYEIEAVDIGQGLRLANVSSGKEYYVQEKMGTYGAKPGMLLVGRILPLNQGYMLAGGLVNIFNQNQAKFIRKELKSRKLNPEGFNELMWLATMKRKAGYLPLETHMTPDQIKWALNESLHELNLELSLSDMAKLIRDSRLMEQTLATMIQKCETEIQAGRFMTLFNRWWNGLQTKERGARANMGHKEQTLMLKFFDEFRHKFNQVEEMNNEERQKLLDRELNRFLDRLAKPNTKETIREIILQERRQSGRHDTGFGLQLQLTPFNNTPTLEKQNNQVKIYNTGMRFYKEHRYAEAIEQFAGLFDGFEGDENEKRWYLNVGVNLVAMGLWELGNRYVAQALKIDPSYSVAQKNLKLWQQTTVKFEAIWQSREYQQQLIGYKGLSLPNTRGEGWLRSWLNQVLATIDRQPITWIPIQRKPKQKEVKALQALVVQGNWPETVTERERLVKFLIDMGQKLNLIHINRGQLRTTKAYADWCQATDVYQWQVIIKAWWGETPEHLWLYPVLWWLANDKDALPGLSGRMIAKRILLKRRADIVSKIILPITIIPTILKPLAWAGLVTEQSKLKGQTFCISTFGQTVVVACEDRILELVPRQLINLMK